MTVKELRELLATDASEPWWTNGHGCIYSGEAEDAVVDVADTYLDGADSLIVALRNSADAMLDVVEAAKALDDAWDRLDRCIEVGFAAEERPDIARSRVIRSSRSFRAALAKLEGTGK